MDMGTNSSTGAGGSVSWSQQQHTGMYEPPSMGKVLPTAGIDDESELAAAADNFAIAEPNNNDDNDMSM